MSYRIVAFAYIARGADRRTSAEVTQLLGWLFKSATACDPDVSLTVLSDLSTEFATLPAGVEIVRYSLSTTDLMLARTEAQARYVAEYAFDLPLAFLDFDILVNRPLGELFARDFDVAVTWRRKENMPINGGVIFANNRRPDRVRRFFTELHQKYRERYSSLSKWWGDQKALNDLVPVPLSGLSGEVAWVGGEISYLLLPASKYNFSPHCLWATLAWPRSSKYLLHFKSGYRKKYIGAFFEFHRNGARVSPARLFTAYRSVREFR